MSPQEKKESIIRLLFSVDILLHSSAFVGSITSGPSVFVMKVRVDDPYVTAIDCSDHPNPLLTPEGKKKIRISGRICGFFYLMRRIESAYAQKSSNGIRLFFRLLAYFQGLS